MRTCVHHGEESSGNADFYRCQKPGCEPLFCCQTREAVEHAPCFVPLPAAAPEDNVPDSSPVTFAAVLRYHRRRAQARDGDQAWHEEAVECLVDLVNYFDRCDAECECCDMADCYLREARKAVEGEG